MNNPELKIPTELSQVNKRPIREDGSDEYNVTKIARDHDQEQFGEIFVDTSFGNFSWPGPITFEGALQIAQAMGSNITELHFGKGDTLKGPTEPVYSHANDLTQGKEVNISSINKPKKKRAA